MTNPIPDNYPRLTPALCVDGASDAIEFYTNVLKQRMANEPLRPTTRRKLRIGGRT